MFCDESANRPRRLRHCTRAIAIARQHVAILILIASLKPELPNLVGGLAGVRETVGADDRGRPAVAFAIWAQLFGDCGEEDANCREALLPIHHADGLHHSFRPRFREREKCSAVVACVGLS